MQMQNKPRRWNPLTHWIVAVLTTVLVAMVGSIVALIYYHETIIDSIYRNVVDVNDGEMPVTVTSYPSGPEVVSIIGGSGEGLNCSLPWLTDLLFEHGTGPDGRRRLVRQKFRQACVFHDLCYRHGLATYGYSQNDCDRILQDQAYRLCQYLQETNKSADECQSDAKKVLAGVSVRGYGAYRAWDRSTFFEFDTNPLRSIEFTASRVVDHPFKPIDAEKYKSDPNQIILSFHIKRANVRLICANCREQIPPVKILEHSHRRQDVSKEFKDVGIHERPDALIGHDLSMSESRRVWLPPGRHHAAPHLLLDKNGGHHLIWMSRSNIEDTGACIIAVGPNKLFTYTLPQVGGCHPGANRQLSPVDVDMFSSSPQPMIVASSGGASDGIIATGLSAQKDSPKNLYLCAWSAKRADAGSKAACQLLKGDSGPIGPDLGAFQNFPIIRADQQLYFARDITAKPASSTWADWFDRATRSPFSPEGRVLVLDVAPHANWSGNSGIVTVKRTIRFDIDDRYDPIVPISGAKDDFRFLSITSTEDQAAIHLINLDDKRPQPVELKPRMGSAELMLHGSWARRPVFVVESKRGDSAKTQLIFSRSGFLPAKDENSDRVRLQFVVLEREASASNETSFSYQRGVTCDVIYTITRQNPARACFRSFDPVRPMRASPVALMQAAQLLVGRFNAKKDPGLALIDRCFEQSPLIFDPTPADGADEGGYSVEARSAEDSTAAGALKRKVVCAALNKPEQIRSPMSMAD